MSSDKIYRVLKKAIIYYIIAIVWFWTIYSINLLNIAAFWKFVAVCHLIILVIVGVIVILQEDIRRIEEEFVRRMKEYNISENLTRIILSYPEKFIEYFLTRKFSEVYTKINAALTAAAVKTSIKNRVESNVCKYCGSNKVIIDFNKKKIFCKSCGKVSEL